MFKVFLGSTFKDLHEHRAAVLAEEPEPVVVLGPPGIGKSKVTVAALHDPEVKVRFGERRWFVPLETAPEPEAILGQVALRGSACHRDRS